MGSGEIFELVSGRMAASAPAQLQNSLLYVQNSQDDFVGEVRLPVTSLASESGELKTLPLKDSDSDKVHPVSLCWW